MPLPCSTARRARPRAAVAALRATVAVAAGCATTAARAGIVAPSGDDVIRRMHARYAGRWYTTLTFTQDTETHLPNDSVRRETWYEAKRLPGRLRIDRGARDGRDVILFNGDSSYRRRGGTPLPTRHGRNELSVLDFDVYGQPPARTAGQLRELGYDLGRVGEAEWQGRAVWTLGAATGDTAGLPPRRQFWVDRERLVVVRILRPGFRDGTRAAEVRFGGYRPLAGGWIAPEVTVLEGGRVLQREVYRDVRANVALPDSLFDPTRLR